MSLAASLALVAELKEGSIESRLSNVDILTFVNGRVNRGIFDSSAPGHRIKDAGGEPFMSRLACARPAKVHALSRSKRGKGRLARARRWRLHFVQIVDLFHVDLVAQALDKALHQRGISAF
jgi:hypothetical protein